MKKFLNVQPIFSLLLCFAICVTCNGHQTTRLSHSAVKFGSGNGVCLGHQQPAATRRRGAVEMRGKDTAPKVIIAGAPAAGVSTQCEMITAKFGVIHLSTGSILRNAVKEGTPLGMKAKAYMDAGQLVPDDLITGVICSRLSERDCQTRGWLLDGFPRTKSQAEALSAAGMKPDCFVMLGVTETIMLERATGRRTDPATGKIYHMKFNPPENDEVASRLVQRSDDTAAKITVRYKEFQSHVDAIRSYYVDKLVQIDGSTSQSEVSKCIFDLLLDVSAQKAKESVSAGSTGASKRAGLFRLQGGYTEGSSADSVVTQMKAVRGVIALVLMDKAMALLFKSKKWGFPSALAAMVGVFLALCDLRKYNLTLAENISNGLSPAVSLIKAWLPLFFVPPLVVLPLKMHLLEGVAVQLSAVVVIGSILSLSAAGLFAQAIDKLFPKAKESASTEVVKSSPLPSLPPLYLPATAMAAFLTLSKLIPMAFPGVPSSVRTILQTAFGSTATVTGYIAGTRLPNNVKKIAHPVLTCAVITTLLLSLFGLVNGVAPASVLAQYFGSGSMRGSGDIISSMLGPAIISFGIQLYQYRVMLRDNIVNVMTTTAFSAGFGLTSSAFLAKIFRLAPAQTALAPLTRCITTPLALAGARLTGADPSLSAFVVVITGILGATFGDAILNTIRVKEPVSVGLAVGAGAHGLGAAAMAYDPVKFASAIVSMTLTGLWTVGIMSYAPIRKWLVRISLS